MNIDFVKEVELRKEAILKDLTGIIRINSELTTYDESRVNAPFGEGIDEALTFMLNLGKRDGFNVLNDNHFAGHIELGNQLEYVGMIGHLDVVPAGSGWHFAPYGAEISDGKMYGRGTEDDKGPTIAAYYAMKIIKDLNIPLKRRIKLILGTDEETGWRGVSHYFKAYPEQPVSGFIPDAEFPLTYGEKGILKVTVKGKLSDTRIVSLDAGLRDNMVPDHVKLVLKSIEFKHDFDQYIVDHKLSGTSKVENNTLVLELDGKSAHGSTPAEGINAAYLMIHFLNQIGIKNQFTDVINTYLLDDTEGKKLGISHKDPEMGGVTVNAGVFKVSNNQFEITLNPRYPHGVNPDQFIEAFKTKFGALGCEVVLGKHQKLLYVDPKSPMIQTLMNTYKKYSKDYDAVPLTTGGGTFARAMKNSVAFGPHFPNKPSYIHQKDEYIILDDFFMSIAIYADALLQLVEA